MSTSVQVRAGLQTFAKTHGFAVGVQPYHFRFLDLIQGLGASLCVFLIHEIRNWKVNH